MDARDDITKEWFQPGTVSVEVNTSTDNGWLDTHTITLLSDAPKNSKVIVSLIGDDDIIELRVKNPGILAEDMVRLLYQTETGFKFQIQNAAFVLTEKLRGLGLGARSFAIEATAAAQEGLSEKIVTSAIGDFRTLSLKNFQHQYSGYFAWARVGFDAPLPSQILTRRTGELLNVTRLCELMRTKAGRELWMEYGGSTEMEFDLAKDSLCWRTLRSYMIETGIRIWP